MADPVIDDIKSRVDIVDLIGRYVTLKRAGINFKGNCPFHNEKTPSFMVNRERQVFRCFGCGEAGDAFAFIMKQENLDFGNALKLLAAQVGVELPEKTPKRDGSPDKSTLFAVNETATKFFNQVLTSHPAGKEALDYLTNRGVSRESIATFLIGYAPANQQPIRAVYAKQNTAPTLLKAAGSPDRYMNRIVFPFRDVLGRVVGFSGRAMGDQQPKYLNTAETPLFYKNRFIYGLFEAKKAIGEAKKIILVEGQLDLVLAHQAGTPYTVATSGTALTDDHLKVLRRYSETLILAFDGDAAGRKATERAVSLALPHGFEVTVVNLPDGTDPGDMCAKDPDAWRKAVQNAIPVIDWLFSYYFAKTEKPSASEREKIYTALFPYIERQPDSVTQSYALQRLARQLGLSQDKPVLDAFEKWKTESKTKTETPKPKVEQETTEAHPEPTEPVFDESTKRERTMVGLLLVHPEFLAHPDLALVSEDFTNAGLAKLYSTIKTWYTEHTTQSATHLISYVETTFTGAAKAAFQKLLFDTQSYIGEATPQQVLEEYTLLVQVIRQRQKEDRIASFASRIAEAEASNDRARVIALMQEMQHTLQKEMHAKKDS